MTSALQILGWVAGLGLLAVLFCLLFLNTSSHSQRSQARAYREDQEAKIQQFRDTNAVGMGITLKPKAKHTATVYTEEPAKPAAVYTVPAESQPQAPVMTNIVPEVWEAAMNEADTLIKMVTHTENGSTVNISGRVGLYSDGPKGGLILELGDESLSATVPVYLPQAVLDKCGSPAWGQPIAIKGIVHEGKRRGIIANYWHEPVAQVA